MRVHRVVCPGSFDPVTNGHLDIIRRAALLHDEVLVVVGANRAKHGMFTVDERVAMLEEVTKDLGNVSVDTFRGLLVEYCRARGVSAIVKGLRAVSDFEYEMEMAQMNYRLAEVETLFIDGEPALLVPAVQPGAGDRRLRRQRGPSGAARGGCATAGQAGLARRGLTGQRGGRDRFGSARARR